eukprot:4414921-Prymnesium_polylepis.1
MPWAGDTGGRRLASPRPTRLRVRQARARACGGTGRGVERTAGELGAPSPEVGAGRVVVQGQGDAALAAAEPL